MDKEKRDIVLEALRNRGSVREYLDKEISSEVLNEIIETSRFSPSGMNKQNYKITVIKNKSFQERILNALRAILKDESYNGFYDAPYFLLISAPEENSNGLADCSCVALNFMNAAYTFDLGTVWVNQLKNNCHNEEVRSVLDDLDIPKNHVVWVSLALGYPNGEIKTDRENKSEVTIIN